MKAQSAEFSRNLGFISEIEQERLINSTVAIAGAGGDGGMLAIQMARMGVGNIRLADPDPFEAENINRQARATSNTIGKNKALVIGEYVTEINPSINVSVCQDGINRENATDFVRGADLLIDETEFSIHSLGVCLARRAREERIPNLMAMNLGFGTTVTTYHPKGKTLEDSLGLDKEASLDKIEETEVPLERWLAYIPPYVDIEVFEKVAKGEKSAPSIAPGVNLASALGATQAFLNLVEGIENNRPKPVYAPNVLMMDVMTGESKLIKRPRLSSRIYLARLAINNLRKVVPKASY